MKLRLTGFLWTGAGKPPREYSELVMCRDLYGCTPSQLAEEDPLVLMDHLALYNEEQRLLALKSKLKR